MGHAVERAAAGRGHKTVCIIDAGQEELYSTAAFRSADVAIEFTSGGVAVDNILRAFAAGVPVVSGSTGWNDSLPDLRDMCLKGAGTLMHSSNFSIGVAVTRAVNRYLARLMDGLTQYTPSLVETHHIHKLDHPSGTAIALAEDIVEVSARVGEWREPEPADGDGPLADGAMRVDHVRRDEVPGIHTVAWDSASDTITLTHSAKSRDGFALGAVTAAEWLRGRKGFFTMADMLPFLRD